MNEDEPHWLGLNHFPFAESPGEGATSPALRSSERLRYLNPRSWHEAASLSRIMFFLLSGLSESNYLAEAIIPAPQLVCLVARRRKTQGGILNESNTAKHQILTKMSQDSPSLTEYIYNFINIYWFWVNGSEENCAASSFWCQFKTVDNYWCCVYLLLFILKS